MAVRQQSPQLSQPPAAEATSSNTITWEAAGYYIETKPRRGVLQYGIPDTSRIGFSTLRVELLEAIYSGDVDSGDRGTCGVGSRE